MGGLLSTDYNDQENEVPNHTATVFPETRIMEHGLQPRRLRNPPVTILNEILREKIKLDAHLVTENNAILKSFLDTFIPEMKKQDKMFELLFQTIFFTGSYYSDLRISTPDEFDLNLILKLPFNAKNVSVQYQSQVPSYVKYSVSDVNTVSTYGLSKLFENEYLIPQKVRVWMQSVVDRAVKTYTPPRNVAKVKCTASGPARTIILVKRDGSVIDIDLVPVVECSLNLKPPGIDGRVFEKVKNNLQCFLVPKPYQPSRQSPVSETERSRLWRAHYPKAESELIHNIECVKPIIKLLKLLRDKENWKIIASYYLKTIVLWMVLENSNRDSWKNDQIGEKFMEALKILQSCIEQKKIRYFFSSRYNLLEKLSDEQAFNIHHRLRIIIRDIERDANNLWTVLGCRRTFNMT